MADPENIMERGSLIAELGLKLVEEKERYDLLKSESELARYVACLELEKYKREYFSLKEKMGRMVEDYNILKERELKDQEKIKGLLVEIERKKREFKDKFVELKLENRDVECGNRKAMSEVSEWKKSADFEDKVSMLVDEIVWKDIEIKMMLVEKKDLACATKRAEDEAHEWMNKYKELQARESRLDEEITQLKEKEKEGFKDELPKRSADPLKKSHRVDSLLTPELRSTPIVVVYSDDEGEVGDDIGDENDRITVSQRKRRKHSNLIDVDKKASSLRKVGNCGAKKTCNKVSKMSHAQTLSLQRKKVLEVADTRIQTIRKSTTRKPYSASTGSGPELCALRKAEELRSNLKSSHPSFIRSMIKSHVRCTFLLRIPTEFCKENLPADKMKMVLEDEKGLEYNVIYIGRRSSISGGWVGFASSHHLELGDALLFELCEPMRFKVYIIKANLEASKEKDSDERMS